MPLASKRGAAGELPAGVAQMPKTNAELRRLVAALHEHDHMLTLAFGAARDMMMLARVEPGPVFRVRSVNRRYVETVRRAGIDITEEWMIGRTFDELQAKFEFPPEAWAGLMARYHQVVETRETLDYDEVSATPNGTYYGQSTLTPVCDETGACCFVLYASTDVTNHKRAERALRESEEKFSKAFRASPGALFITDLESGRFIDANEGCERIFGYSREHCIGRTSAELRLFEDYADRQRVIDLVRANNGTMRDLEIRGRKATGEQVSVLLSCEIIELEGRPHLVTVAYDITQRKRAEQALRESEARFSKTFRASPGALFITEFETGRIIDANDGCERIFGYSAAYCIGRTVAELGVYADYEDRARLVERVRANNGTLRDLEVRCRKANGEPVSVLVSCETIELERQPYLVTVVFDITARKQAEQALRESEAKFAKAFHASPGGMAISDMETRQFIEVSEGYCRILDYTREEMIGRSGVELDLWVHEKDRVKFLSDFTAERGLRDYEVEARRRDGKSVFVLLSGEVFELNGRICGLTTIVDITARRLAELERNALEAQLRQAQKLEALGQLAGGIAHDFNNILTGIGAYSELALMDAERAPQVRKHLAQVRRATERATDLVRQILTFSRQTAHERRVTRLPLVIGEALKLLRSSIPRSIEIVENIDAAAPLVLADTTQIHQVVMNLCTNAAHAMRERPGRLTVELGAFVVAADAPGSRDLSPGRYARLVVTDTGHGMDEATLGRIFEPFFTTKGPGEGTGLGLSVVHGIVEDHDGVITVRSKRGEGTTFEICLPEHVALVPAEIESNPDIPRGRGQRILYVDDETVVGEGVAEILRRLGYRVTLQKEAKMAAVLFDAAPAAFDAVVTDLAMPQLTGIEFARRVLARRPDIPVVLATGHLGAWSAETLRAIGIRAWIAKPITSAKIAHALREALTTAPAPVAVPVSVQPAPIA